MVTHGRNALMFSVTNPDEDNELPTSMLPLTSPDLDHDEAAARRAADLILSVHRRVLDGFSELEWMERALRESEPVSARAQEARTDIRKAMEGLEESIA